MKRFLVITAAIAFTSIVIFLAVTPSDLSATRVWVERSPVRYSKEPPLRPRSWGRLFNLNRSERFPSVEEWQRAGRKIPNIESNLLILLAKEADSYTLSRIIWGMGFVSGKESVPALISILESDRPLLQCEAAEALARIGDDRAIGPLRAALTSDDSDVRNIARKSLEFAGWSDCD